MKKLILYIFLVWSAFATAQPISPTSVSTNSTWLEPSTGTIWQYYGTTLGWRQNIPSLTGTSGLYLKSNGTTVSWATAASTTPTLDQVLNAGNTSTLGASIGNLFIGGTAGGGYIDLRYQGAVPSTPASSHSRFYANASGYMSYLQPSGYSVSFYNPYIMATGNSLITMPNLANIFLVDQTRTLTINGVAQDLSADRSWTIAAGVSSVTGSGNIASSGGATPNITFTGLLPISNGGTGTATPGIVAGTNITVSGTWPNQTVNSTASGGVSSFNTRTGAVVPVAGDYASLTETLTNKTISGSSNTLSNIGNSSLTNSTISGVSLGGTLFAHTPGYGLSGSPYTGASAQGFIADTTVLKSKVGFLTDYNNLSGRINNKQDQVNKLGYIYQGATGTFSLGSFTNNGGTFSLSGGNIVASGGANTSTQTLDLSTGNSAHTMLSKWRQEVGSNVPTISSTSYGAGPSLRSTNAQSGFFGIQAHVNTSTTGTTGQLIITYPNGSVMATSPTNLAVTAGDALLTTLELKGYLAIATSYNITQGSSPVTAVYQYSATYGAPYNLPNTGQFGIASFGGTVTITSYNIYSDEDKSPDILFLGLSKWAGYYSISPSNSSPYLVGKNFKVAVSAGGNDETTDVLLHMTEAKSLTPKVVILEPMSNDVRYAVPLATTEANIVNIVNQWNAIGVTVLQVLPLVETSGVNYAPLKAWMLANYASTCIDTKIETYATSVTLAGDGIHLTPFGEQVVANAETAFLLNMFPKTSNYNTANLPNTLGYFNNNGGLGAMQGVYSSDGTNILIGERTPTGVETFGLVGTANNDIIAYQQRASTSTQNLYTFATAGALSNTNQNWLMGLGNTYNTTGGLWFGGYNGTTVHADVQFLYNGTNSTLQTGLNHYTVSTFGNYAFDMTGQKLNASGLWQATSTEATSWGGNAGSFMISYNSGLTVGSTFTPTNILKIDANGAVPQVSSLTLPLGSSSNYWGNAYFNTSNVLVRGSATSIVDGYVSNNNVAAISATPVQNGPAFTNIAHTWNTSGTPADNYAYFTSFLRPSSSATPTSAMVWKAYIGASSTPTYGSDLMTLDNSGNLTAGNSVNVGALGYTDTGILGSFTSTQAGYNQLILRNLSNATNASANLVVNNDVSTASNLYGELGQNSSTFTGTGSLSGAGNVYVDAVGEELAIGTTGANGIHFVVNSGATDAATFSSTGKFTINAGQTWASNISAAAWGNNTLTSVISPQFNISATTLTDNSSAASTTLTNSAINTVGIGTFAATNVTNTITNGYGLLLLGDPLAGTNETVTNKYAFGNAGKSNLIGAVTLGSTINGLTLTAGTGTLTLAAGTNTFGSLVINALATGTGVASAATASTLAARDANKNLTANNYLSSYTTTATAAGTTTLVVGSTYQQFFTGSSTQTVQLPVASTLVLGQAFLVTNNSTGVVTINSSGANLVTTVAPNATAIVTCILASGTTAASWSYTTTTSTAGIYANTTATDANTTIATSYAFYMLPTVTANRTLSIPSAANYSGQEIKIDNTNSSGTFTWSFTGATVKDANSNTLSTLTNGSFYQLISNGTNWIKEN